ncbi:hypothetical protein [Thauera sp. SDU_THAU2]|uniref:hypothetical protein n=1 Tax=Thauera sp. SDU_THAU2 TaxID=3136633 RepID=UPI00311FE822
MEVYGPGALALAEAPAHAAIRALAARVELSGETVFFYTADAGPAAAGPGHVARGLHTLHRPANLEDLFLKLTSRQDPRGRMNTPTPSHWSPRPAVDALVAGVPAPNLLVWRKLAIPSLVGNIAEPLMWLVAFGYGMGALVGQVNMATPQGTVAVPYILFPGQRQRLHEHDERRQLRGAVLGLLAHARAEDLGRHHERAGAAGRRGAGRDAVGGVQVAVRRHRHPGRDAGAGHQPFAQAAAGAAGGCWPASPSRAWR